MEKKLIISIGLGLALLLQPIIGIADQQAVTLNQLIEESEAYDGRSVVVNGEVLLEAMERTDGTWININDGTNAMGVFMSTDAANTISKYGNYHTVGDCIEIEAVFHRSCKTHGGEMDLHFIQFRNIEPGYDKDQPLNTSRIWIAGLTTLGTLSLILYYLYSTGQFEKWQKVLKNLQRDELSKK